MTDGRALVRGWSVLLFRDRKADRCYIIFKHEVGIAADAARFVDALLAALGDAPARARDDGMRERIARGHAAVVEEWNEEAAASGSVAPYALISALQNDHDGSLLDNLGGFLSQGNPDLGGAARTIHGLDAERREVAWAAVTAVVGIVPSGVELRIDPDEVHAAARRTLDPAKAAVVVAGPYDGSPT